MTAQEKEIFDALTKDREESARILAKKKHERCQRFRCAKIQ